MNILRLRSQNSVSVSHPGLKTDRGEVELSHQAVLRSALFIGLKNDQIEEWRTRGKREGARNPRGKIY